LQPIEDVLGTPYLILDVTFSMHYAETRLKKKRDKYGVPRTEQDRTDMVHHRAEISKKVARLRPIGVIKG